MERLKSIKFSVFENCSGPGSAFHVSHSVDDIVIFTETIFFPMPPTIILTLLLLPLAQCISVAEFIYWMPAEYMSKAGLDVLPQSVHQQCAMAWPLIKIELDPNCYAISDAIFDHNLSDESIQLLAICLAALMNTPQSAEGLIRFPQFHRSEIMGQTKDAGLRKVKFFANIFVLSFASLNTVFRAAMKPIAQKLQLHDLALELAVEALILENRNRLWDYVWQLRQHGSKFYESMCLRAVQTMNMKLVEALLKCVPKFSMADRLIMMANVATKNRGLEVLAWVFHETMQYQGPDQLVIRLDILGKLMAADQPLPEIMSLMQLYVHQLTDGEKQAVLLHSLSKPTAHWVVFLLQLIDPECEGEIKIQFSTMLAALTHPDNFWQVKPDAWKSLVSYYALSTLMAPFRVRNYPIVFETGAEIDAVANILSLNREARRLKQLELDAVERWYVMFVDVWSKLFSIGAHTKRFLADSKSL
jgi:hypothetical protein